MKDDKPDLFCILRIKILHRHIRELGEKKGNGKVSKIIDLVFALNHLF